MKKVLLVAGMALCFGIAVNAQNANPAPSPTTAAAPMMKKHHDGNKMKAELGLSDDQAAQIEAMKTDAKNQAKMMKSDSSMTKKQKHAKMKDMEMANNDKMKSILTADQYSKWTAMKEEKKAKMKQKKAMKKDDAQK